MYNLVNIPHHKARAEVDSRVDGETVKLIAYDHNAKKARQPFGAGLVSWEVETGPEHWAELLPEGTGPAVYGRRLRRNFIRGDPQSRIPQSIWHERA